MDTAEIRRQSESAYKQWCIQWRENAKFHSQYKSRSFEDFRNTGIGKAVLLVANGYSFEENIETIKQNWRNIDVVACDKTLGHLLDHGIKPKFVVVCDANISYEKYLKPWEDQLDKTILIQNVCGNPEWTKNGNWKKTYFYVNKDIMNNEIEFSKLSGCHNFFTAGTNVSNMMLVAITQCDNERRQNIIGYDKILLVGFDYSWKDSGSYYSFDRDGGGKTFYMRHVYGIANSGALIYTSNNLSASCSWIKKYITAFGLNVVQCSKDSLLTGIKMGDLKDHINYRHKPSDMIVVNNLVSKRHSLERELKQIDNDLKKISHDHWFASQSV